MGPGPNPAPEPALLSSVTFKMPTKNFFFGLLLFEETFTSFFEDKKS
jgi:hypothetical protein